MTQQQIIACITKVLGFPAPVRRRRETYIDGYVGAALHNHFGREFHGYLSYQFNELWFDQSFVYPVRRASDLESLKPVTLGLDWTPGNSHRLISGYSSRPPVWRKSGQIGCKENDYKS